jgi:hypothetical protein
MHTADVLGKILVFFCWKIQKNFFVKKIKKYASFCVWNLYLWYKVIFPKGLFQVTRKSDIIKNFLRRQKNEKSTGYPFGGSNDVLLLRHSICR